MISEHILECQATIRDALIKLNNIGPDVLNVFVVDSTCKVLGSVTDGDIRRYLINSGDLTSPVSEVMNKQFERIIKDEYSLSDLDRLRKKKIKMVPLVDRNDHLVELVDLSKLKSVLPVDVLIMAGGEGKRLQPYTNTIPKPMLVVGDKPIIEHNIDRLISFGVKNFYISIRYLGQKIIDHFGDGSGKGISIKYVWEDEPLGTLGAFRTIKTFQSETILVMNSDLLTTIDFEDFYRSYIVSNADLGIASIPYQVNIPYAVLEIENNNVLSFEEKPTYNYYSNAGIYLLNKNLVEFVPDKGSFNATDLIDELIKRGKKISSFPILSYWLDIGRPEDFMKAIKDIKHLDL
jgi:dTDP-glucose pyrophosphorylase